MLGILYKYLLKNTEKVLKICLCVLYQSINVKSAQQAELLVPTLYHKEIAEDAINQFNNFY